MRHFFVARPVAALSRGMAASPRGPLLVALSGDTAARGAGPAGRSLRHNKFGRGRSSCRSPPASDSPRKGTAALTLPRHEHANTPGGRTPRLPGYWPCIRAQHGVGHGVEPNRQVQISAPCLPLKRAQSYPPAAVVSACGGTPVPHRTHVHRQTIKFQKLRTERTSGRQISRAGYTRILAAIDNYRGLLSLQRRGVFLRRADCSGPPSDTDGRADRLLSNHRV